MKMTYVERIERKTAISRKMYCAYCGGHEYEIVEQVEPEVDLKWFVRCPACGAEGYEAPARDIAIGRWKQNQCG